MDNTDLSSDPQVSEHQLTFKAGWINELIARLTDSPLEDETTTNRTLDADEATFPLGGERIFAVCVPAR